MSGRKGSEKDALEFGRKARELVVDAIGREADLYEHASPATVNLLIEVVAIDLSDTRPN